MKRLIATVAILGSATAAYADTSINGKVYDHYRNVTKNIPVVHEDCYNVQVPVYRTERGSGADAVVGAIIGGAIGNQFGGGSGKDAMTVLGAIVGANVANAPRDRVAGYREERRCDQVTLNKSVQSREYSHSTIEFVLDGKRYTLEFVK